MVSTGQARYIQSMNTLSLCVSALRRSSAFLLTAILISLTSLLFPGAARAENTEHSQVPKILSILDFSDNCGNPEYLWLSAGLADMLITDLAPGDITLVDRADLNEALAEQSLALAGITDDTALEIGRMVSADAILSGSYALAGTTLRIDARIADVTTGEVISAVSVSGPGDGIFSLEARLAGKICEVLGIRAPAGLGDPGTVSQSAARAYYEGVALQDSGDVEAARKRFEEAAELDPLYAKPRYSLEESWQLLKDFRSLRQQREVNTLWKKAEALKQRLAEDPFTSDSDLIMAAYTAGTPAVQTGTPPADNPTLGSCPNPAVCLWNLQITYWEIGSSSAEYFGDTTTEKAALEEIIRLADQADSAWPEDEWLPEILYWKVMGNRWLENWAEVRAGCERIFIQWPDFRMAWALEDMYETALEN
jgi:TolB-like protein